MTKQMLVMATLGLMLSTLRLTAQTTRDAQSGCENVNELLSQVWNFESELVRAGDGAAPATTARKLYRTGQQFEKRILECEIVAANTSRLQQKEMLSAERINLQFIDSAQIAYGGLGQVPNPSFPADLGDVAPSCKPVILSQLAERVERFASQHRTASNVTADEIKDLYADANSSEGAGLTVCASEAQQAGYKDAAMRLLLDAFMIENFAHLAALNAQSQLVKILASRTDSTTTRIEVGAQHCTATLQDWGFQKTVHWDCF